MSSSNADSNSISPSTSTSSHLNSSGGSSSSTLTTPAFKKLKKDFTGSEPMTCNFIKADDIVLVKLDGKGDWPALVNFNGLLELDEKIR